MLKGIFVGLIVFMTAGITLGKTLLSRLGMDENILLIALIAFCVSGLLIYRQLLFVIIIVALAAAINLPQEILAQYYLDQDILMGTLVVLIILPLVRKIMDH